MRPPEWASVRRPDLIARARPFCAASGERNVFRKRNSVCRVGGCRSRRYRTFSGDARTGCRGRGGWNERCAISGLSSRIASLLKRRRRSRLDEDEPGLDAGVGSPRGSEVFSGDDWFDRSRPGRAGASAVSSRALSNPNSYAMKFAGRELHRLRRAQFVRRGSGRRSMETNVAFCEGFRISAPSATDRGGATRGWHALHLRTPPFASQRLAANAEI